MCAGQCWASLFTNTWHSTQGWPSNSEPPTHISLIRLDNGTKTPAFWLKVIWILLLLISQQAWVDDPLISFPHKHIMMTSSRHHWAMVAVKTTQYVHCWDHRYEDPGGQRVRGPGGQGTRGPGIQVWVWVSQCRGELPFHTSIQEAQEWLSCTPPHKNTEEQNWLICQHSASASKKSVIHGISEDETTNSTGISLRSRTLKTLFIHCKAAGNADTLTKVFTLPSCPNLAWQPTLQDGILNTLRNQNKECYNANVLIMFIYFKKRYLLSVTFYYLSLQIISDQYI